MKEKILTLHPEGKQGVNISKEKYDSVKDAIIKSLQDKGELTFTKLGSEVKKELGGKFEGSISWYYTTVKLDLEARGKVMRIPGSSPQRIKLKK